MFVDSYPSLESWTAGNRAIETDPAGKVIQAEINALTDCSRNSLHVSSES
jgi:hypothetical protein